MSQPFVLIVEDDPKLGNIFTLTLKKDFQTELCNDGLAALERLAQITPDLIVLDLHLPGASGEEILESVRANPRLEHTRVILATADHIRADLLDDQAEIVLLKPISPTQLQQLAVRLCKET
jgi:CheY-like chemotaxis protein